MASANAACASASSCSALATSSWAVVTALAAAATDSRGAAKSAPPAFTSPTVALAVGEELPVAIERGDVGRGVAAELLARGGEGSVGRVETRLRGGHPRLGRRHGVLRGRRSCRPSWPRSRPSSCCTPPRASRRRRSRPRTRPTFERSSVAPAFRAAASPSPSSLPVRRPGPDQGNRGGGRRRIGAVKNSGGWRRLGGPAAVRAEGPRARRFGSICWASSRCRRTAVRSGPSVRRERGPCSAI